MVCRPLLILTLLLALPTVACSTYGWADQPIDEEDGDPRLRVAPVTAPAHLGLDEVTLRALLVETLELRGLDVTTADDAPSLECSVLDHRATGFGFDVVAELTLSCDIWPVGADSATATLAARGMAADHLDPSLDVPVAALRTEPRVGDSAVADAISRLGPRIADAVFESDTDLRPPDTHDAPRGSR